MNVIILGLDTRFFFSSQTHGKAESLTTAVVFADMYIYIYFLFFFFNCKNRKRVITLRAKLNPYLERGMIMTFFVCETEPKTK